MIIFGLILEYVLSGLLGAFFGMTSAILVGNSLAEITFSPVFSIIFCLILQIFGMMMIYRVLGKYKEKVSIWNKLLIVFFALLIMFSGLICIVLDIKTLPNFSFLIKIPLYVIVGIGLSFSFTFSLIELSTAGKIFFSDVEQPKMIKSILSHPLQIFALTLSSIVVGSMFGLLFSVLDVEDEKFIVHSRFLVQQLLSLPISIIIGSFLGIANKTIEIKEKEAEIMAFDPNLGQFPQL